MKTNPFSSAFSALVIAAILFAGLVRIAAAADPDPRFASDKPVVKCLFNGTVALPARTMKVSKACESGAATAMMKMMSNNGNSALVYNLTHDLHPSDILAGKLLIAGGKLSLAAR